MKFLEGREAYEAAAKDAIARFGFAPEHNLDDYEYSIDEDTKNIFVSFPDRTGILAKSAENSWWVLIEPLAKEAHRAPRLCEFLMAVLLERGAKKVYIEVGGITRKKLLKILPPRLRALSIIYSLTWPVFDLSRFNPELRGNYYKKIRSEVTQFKKRHEVKVKSAYDISKKELLALVDRWLAGRRGRDRAFGDYYKNFIVHDFRGTDSARAIIVDGKIVGLNAGWRIPNSDCYYKAIGLHDYSFQGLGDYCMVEELTWLKENGYERADFGGGEKSSTNFKKRFGASEFYKTFYFSVVRDTIKKHQ